MRRSIASSFVQSSPSRSRQRNWRNKEVERQAERRRILELEPSRPATKHLFAERRYAACDPTSALIAATLEKNFETALGRVRDCEARLDTDDRPALPTPAIPDLNWHCRGSSRPHGRKMPCLPAMRFRRRTDACPRRRDAIVDIDKRHRRNRLVPHSKVRRALRTLACVSRTRWTSLLTYNDALKQIMGGMSRPIRLTRAVAATLDRMDSPTGPGKTGPPVGFTRCHGVHNSHA